MTGKEEDMAGGVKLRYDDETVEIYEIGPLGVPFSVLEISTDYLDVVIELLKEAKEALEDRDA
jgi:hypothetical protein